jgi:putative phosphoribosyl transferase
MKRSCVTIRAQGVELAGDLAISPGARDLIVLVHGPDRAHYHPDECDMARRFEETGRATLRVDLLSATEQDLPQSAMGRPDPEHQAMRLAEVLDWTRAQRAPRALPLGVFASGTGSEVALRAALLRPDLVQALVIRGDRDHLNGAPTLARLSTPTLILVAGSDDEAIAAGRLLVQRTPRAQLEIVTDAWHSLEGARGHAQLALAAMEFFDQVLPSHPARGQLPSFQHRRHAGERLAEQLAEHAGRPGAIVLAIPKGGVPIGAEVARRLGLPLDVVVTRRVCAPGARNEVIGAVGPDGVLVTDVVPTPEASAAELGAEIARQRRAVRRSERALRAGQPPLRLEGRTVLLVDDGMITGASMRAAVAWARMHLAGRVVVAVPVAPARTIEQVAREADELFCLASPVELTSLGPCYQQFPSLDTGDLAAELARAHADVPLAVSPPQ